MIPCLDVDAGRVVKGVNFVELRDAGDPVELAARYDVEGADELIFLDITASSDARDTILDVVSRTAEQVFMPLTVGGGVREVADFRRLLLAGADKVSVNSAAVARPLLVAEAADKCGSQCVVVAIDARRREDGRGFEVYTHGGRKPTGIDAVEWAARVADLGAGEILLTSMDRDGTGAGFDLPLTRAVNGNPFLITTGASFGAYHAANFAFRHPHLVGRMVGLSGLYVGLPASEQDWPQIDNSLHRYIIERAGNRYIREFFDRLGSYFEILFEWEDHDRDTAIETVRQHHVSLRIMESYLLKIFCRVEAVSKLRETLIAKNLSNKKKNIKMILLTDISSET